MHDVLEKEKIIRQLDAASKEVIDYCTAINDELFFYQPADKWSVAQNISHLAIAANSTLPAFSLPKFIVRIYAGKPNRASRTYSELVTKYQLKLAQGGRAGRKFIPAIVSPQIGKEKVLMCFLNAMNKLSTAIQKKWNENQLDKYIAPHPLLGKVTLRELCYFTIYHTQHHLNSIKERMNEKN